MLLRHTAFRLLGVVLITCWGMNSLVQAQDFKIYTPLYDMNAPQTSPRAGQRPQPEIVSRSQSYFHAGRAYDSIEAKNLEQQVVIYEPNAQRFVILNTSRGMATTISFEEIENMVRDKEENAQKHVLRTREKGDDQATRLDMIEFQLQPSFIEKFDPQRNTLVLKSRQMTYQVKCDPLESPERLQFYLKYCDWMARLNFILLPHSPLPGPRLTLNGSLKKHEMMPTEVTLMAIGSGINLKAEHKIEMQLEPVDRDRIHRWHTLLESDAIRKVDFNRFREVQLTAKR